MMKRISLVLSLFLLSCGGTVNESSVFNVPDAGSTDTVLEDVGASLQGQGVGQACIKDRAGFSDCRPFLKCVDGTCRAAGDTQEGYYCILDDECAPGLHCSITAKCEKSGQGTTYETCVTAADCTVGHYCRVLGPEGFVLPSVRAISVHHVRVPTIV